MNAWVIEFGGGWVEPFVTRKMFDTVEGDWFGITNVFKHLETWEACGMRPAAVDTDNGSSREGGVSPDMEGSESFG